MTSLPKINLSKAITNWEAKEENASNGIKLADQEFVNLTYRGIDTIDVSVNSLVNCKAVKTALVESLVSEVGGKPQTISITDPLSSIKNLFKDPLVKYIHLWTVLTIFWILKIPSSFLVWDKSTVKFKNIIVSNLNSFDQFSFSISKYTEIAFGTKFFNKANFFLTLLGLNWLLIKLASALTCILSSIISLTLKITINLFKINSLV